MNFACFLPPDFFPTSWYSRRFLCLWSIKFSSNLICDPRVFFLRNTSFAEWQRWYRYTNTNKRLNNSLQAYNISKANTIECQVPCTCIDFSGRTWIDIKSTIHGYRQAKVLKLASRNKYRSVLKKAWQISECANFHTSRANSIESKDGSNRSACVCRVSILAGFNSASIFPLLW